MSPRLSKSKYLSGFQCPKRLYLEIHAREVASEFDAGTQAVLDAGTRVGELARERYPGGVLVEVDYFQVADGLARTAAALADPGAPVISEGFIQCEDVLVRPVILVRTCGNRWRLIEVKSTSRVKDEHLDDLAIQAYVLRGAGLAQESVAWIKRDNLAPGQEVLIVFQTAGAARELRRMRWGLMPSWPSEPRSSA